MRIRIDNTWLAPGGLEAAANVSFNGQQIVDEVAFFRALARVFYGRGNRSCAISFTVERSHNTLRDAEVFLLTHYNDLPDEGDAVFVCGEPSAEQSVALLDAVLEAVPNGIYKGTSTRFTYTLRGGKTSTDSIPGGGDVDPDVTRRGTEAIANGATSVVVTFLTPMSGVPTVTCTVLMPTTGGDTIFASVIEDTVTANGFTAALIGPTPATGYKLSYIAIL